ncbi:hypothetical protein F4777DRAFT_596881 [Nemania sp. FL0916]|nr:hypothetical protein F4777DRAFT_596881 [Nemania sp. FL0916]
MYSEFASLVSTVTKNTTITITYGSSTKIVPYSYQIGPGGVGWRIPSSRSEAPIPLDPPTFLPEQLSSHQSSSNSPVSTRHTNVTSPGSGSRLTKTSTATLASSASSHRSNGTASHVSESASNTVTRSNVDSTVPASTTPTGLESSTSNNKTFTGDPTNQTTSSKHTSTGSVSSRSATSNTKPSSSSNRATSSSNAVTSTITQPPTGLSAVTLSGTTFTDNTWITTKDKDDHTTVVPIIVTGGRGIVIWGVPPLTDVQFSFPKLPKFHFPCIKVLGASVGSCPTEPVSDGPPDGGSNPDKSPSTTPSTTKQTSTSTSECSASHTVSNCAVECAKITTSNSCISFTTACSQTQTGCSVTGKTSTITSSTSACTACTSCFERKPAGDGAPPFQTPPPNLDDEELKKRYHARDLESVAKNRWSQS